MGSEEAHAPEGHLVTTPTPCAECRGAGQVVVGEICYTEIRAPCGRCCGSGREPDLSPRHEPALFAVLIESTPSVLTDGRVADTIYKATTTCERCGWSRVFENSIFGYSDVLEQHAQRCPRPGPDRR